MSHFPCLLFPFVHTVVPTVAFFGKQGEEFWGKGTNIQEGPGINIARIDRNGRTFEYISGEDPYLGSILVQPLVDGIQKNVM